MKKIYLILLIFSLFILNVNAKEDYAPTAKSAILVDNATGKV